MKAHFLIPAFFIVAAVASIPSACATTFSQFFNNGPSGTTPHQDKNANTYSWQAAIGTTGVIDSTLSSGDGNAIGVSQGGGLIDLPGSTKNGYLFALPASGAPGVVLLHTTNTATSDVVQNTPNQPAGSTAPNSIQWYRDFPQNLTGLTVADITQLSLHTRAENSAAVMRLAILVDGNWYASETSWQQVSNVSWEPHVQPLASSQWRSGVFSTGALDDDLSDNPVVSLPANGVVSGYGLYADTGALADGAARIRMDAFQISTPFVDPYSQWSQGPFTNDFTDTDPLVDYDQDGLDNLLEFVLGGDPTSNDQPSIRPSIVDASGDNLVVSFHRSDLSELEPATAVVVQTSTDLATWNPADEIPIGPESGTGPNGATYTVDETGALDAITVTVPKNGATYSFVRIVLRR